jgi:hypothetical protein
LISTWSLTGALPCLETIRMSGRCSVEEVLNPTTMLAPNLLVTPLTCLSGEMAPLKVYRPLGPLIVPFWKNEGFLVAFAAVAGFDCVRIWGLRPLGTRLEHDKTC